MMLKPFVALVWANIIPPAISSSKPNTLVLMSVIVLLYGAEPVTITVNEAVPSAVGVPEITAAGESVNPGGSAPVLSDQVYGGMPPVAESVAL